MSDSVEPPQSILAYFNTCPICEKAFTRELSFNRHIKYCRNAQKKRKGRPKACIACNSSKTKCNFGMPQCARCEKKGLDCIYDSQDQSKAVIAAIKAQEIASHSIISPSTSDEYVSRVEQGNWSSSQQPQAIRDLGFPSSQTLYDQELLGLSDVGLDTFKDFIGGVVDWVDGFEFADNQIISSADTASKALAATNYIISKSRSTRALTPLIHENIASRHAANLISRIIGAFPQMMLRRHTFPPFIHPYWHKAKLPDNLANCMSIAQLFVSRTADTRQFLWSTIEAEQKHFRDDKVLFTRAELQQAIQAITIYIVMAIIDHDDDTPARGARLMATFRELKLQLQLLIGGSLIVSETELSRPSLTWEDWIFAESRRRLGCLWFAITRVFALKTDQAHCTGMDDFYNMPLLSSRSIWEARTHDEWESEKCLVEISYPLTTFGELLGALEKAGDAVNARKLDNWEAGADKLGMMMNIAVELAG